MKIFLSLEVPAILEEGMLSMIFQQASPCFLDSYLSNTLSIMLCVYIYIYKNYSYDSGQINIDVTSLKQELW